MMKDVIAQVEKTDIVKQYKQEWDTTMREYIYVLHDCQV